MSQQTAIASDNADQLTGEVSANDEAKSDARAVANLTDYLRRYNTQAGDAAKDTLKERYRVEVGSPLPQYDTPTSRAYAASDIAEPSRQLVAQVCRQGSVQRHRAITQLKTVNHPAILTLADAGIVELSRPEEERFVIFYERPAGKKLSELLGSINGKVSQSFICDYIIAPLASAIHQFSELDISHGAINPDNIYFSDTAMLGPCVSEPCGYGQTFFFEPLERIQSLPAGKGEGTTEHDYYALAVLVLYILHTSEHFAHFTPGGLTRSILKDGVYAALTRNRDLPEIFYDFFRGLLCQNAEDRWSYRHIKPWLDGKRYNVLPPPPPLEAIRPFEFNDNEAGTRRELAHLFANDWEHMLAPISSNKLAHWVSVSLRNKDIAESIMRIGRTVSELSIKNDIQLSEQLMRIILLLDPNGPIRLKHLSFHIDGIESLVAELYNAKAYPDLQIIAKFIEFNMANYWMDLQRKEHRKGHGDYAFSPALNNVFLKLDRLRSCIRNTGFGFGLERMLYDLNPQMPCMSPLLANSHVTTLPALLKKLDRLAPSLSKEDPLDRHIAAFIASKLGIQHEIRLHDLAALPVLAENRTILALHFLSLAHQKAPGLQLHGLTRWLGLRILPMMDNIHSRTLRYKFKSLLTQKAQSGYTEALAEVVINPDYAATDQHGFDQAYNLFQRNAEKIDAYRQGVNMDYRSASMGFSMAKILAYSSVIVSFCFVMKDIQL